MAGSNLAERLRAEAIKNEDIWYCDCELLVEAADRIKHLEDALRQVIKEVGKIEPDYEIINAAGVLIDYDWSR